MKSFIVIATMLCSMVASAAELEVMKVSAQKARGALNTRFEVNLNDGTAGVSLTATRMIGGPRNRHAISKTFEKAVPELALVGDTLVLTANGESVDCGTMGETRIFKRPVLNLSGKCDVVAKRVGSQVVVSIVTE